MKKINRGFACTVAALALVVGGVGLAVAPASATSSTSSTSYPNGTKLTANAWIQSAVWTGCGSFQTSAVIGARPTYITNATSFYQIGIGNVSVKGVSISSSEQGPSTLLWTNSNGAEGSYLSGTVCGGWASVYVGADVTAKAYYDGNLRIASAHI